LAPLRHFDTGKLDTVTGFEGDLPHGPKLGAQDETLAAGLADGHVDSVVYWCLRDTRNRTPTDKNGS